MSIQVSSHTSNQGKVMSDQQLDEVVGAILAGKYSWACVLILKFAGYNPLHYIPYRTYHRIVKDNYESKFKASR
ncbi:MAG: HetP family heterocyst commitment protein [Synechocystis sp.]|nr:HetP family heterocyst commitment protein [Synechocystis sp.]